MPLRLTLEISDVTALTDHERAVLAVITNYAPAANTIAPADRPDVGAVIDNTAKVLASLAEFAPVDEPTAVALVQAEPERDFSKVFGGVAAPSVPIPPPVLTVVAAETPPPPPPLASPAAEIASPPTPAPAATVDVPSAGAGSATEVDVAGLPWDGRIHASTRKKNADGTWRKIRNADKTAAAIIEADLKAAAQIPVPPPGMPIPPASPAASFASFMAWVAKQISAERLKTTDTFEIIQPLGLQSIVSLQTRPDLLPAAYEAMRERIVGGEA